MLLLSQKLKIHFVLLTIAFKDNLSSVKLA